MINVSVYKPRVQSLPKIFVWVVRCLFWHSNDITLKTVRNTLDGRLVNIYTCSKCREITVLE